MTDRDDSLDLRALAPDGDTRERVVRAALARLDAEAGAPPPSSTSLLTAAGRFAGPSLLAAAAVAALMLWPDDGGSLESRPLVTDPLASPLVPVAPGPWAGWLSDRRAPAPEELIVLFTGGPDR